MPVASRNVRTRTAKPVPFPTGKPNPVDVHVGSRVRLRRTLLGFSQEKLGEAIGLTFQQVQKYERGANRIGSSRLYQLSRVLDVPVSFFFEDMPDEISGAKKRVVREAANDKTAESGDEPLMKRETLELVRAYYKINDAQVRKRIFELVKCVGRSFDSVKD